jgi:hypothetical protein
MKHNSKLWSLLCLGMVLAILLVFALPTALIDPFFHYRSPREDLSYPLNNQRYQNDGIVRHFDYDALITGTSMTENFKNSELDALFGTKSVKVSYSGGTFPELTANLEQALEHNPGIKLVLFCIDEWFLSSGRELIQADGAYPEYLYDDNPFNDVEYLLNREIFWENTLAVLSHTRKGLPTTSFDVYGSWVYPYDAEIVRANYNRPEQELAQPFTEADAALLQDTLGNTLVALVRENPETQFIVYFPPYSALTWDQGIRQGLFPKNIELYQMASEILLGEENIQLFSFHTDFETTTDLNNYRDIVHHSDQINSLLLHRFHSGEYRLTEDTYRQHWQEVRDFYQNFDFEALLQSS